MKVKIKYALEKIKNCIIHTRNVYWFAVLFYFRQSKQKALIRQG